MHDRNFAFRQTGDLTIVEAISAALERCEGDAPRCHELREELARIALDTRGPIVLDIRRLRRLDYGGVTLLIDYSRILEARHRKLAVCCTAEISEIFSICRLRHLFSWGSDLENLTSALDGGGQPWNNESPGDGAEWPVGRAAPASMNSEVTEFELLAWSVANENDSNLSPGRSPPRGRGWLGAAVAILVVAVLAVLGCRQFGSQRAASHFQAGVEAFEKDQYHAAIDHFTESIRRYPSWSPSFSNRAAAYAHLGEIDQARRDCQEALRLDPRNAHARGVLGFVALKSGDFALAHAECSAALALDGNQQYARANRGVAALNLGRYDEAVSDATEALRSLRRDVHRAETCACRGAARMHLLQFSEAIPDLSEAIRLNPGEAGSRINRASAHLALNDVDAALADLSAALEQAPQHVGALDMRSRAYFAKQDFAACIADCTAVLEIQPDLVMPYVMRAGARINTGQLDAGIADCDRAIALAPGLALPREYRGNAYLIQGRLPLALDDYNAVIRLDQTMIYSYFNRGRALLQIGQPAQAIDDFTKAMELKPDYAPAYMARSMAYLALGDQARATADLQKALELDPTLRGPAQTGTL